MTKTRPDTGPGDLQARLRALRVDPPDGGFAASLHRRLAEAPPPGPPGLGERLAEGWRRLRAPALPWPAAAALAGAAALGAVLALRAPAPAPAPAGDAAAVATVSLPATRVAVVRLDLSVDVAVQSADIRVSLPDGLVFWSRGEALPDRTFEWSQPLSRGKNEIPIAVRGLRAGRYHLTVTARVGDQWIAHDVPLEVTEG